MKKKQAPKEPNCLYRVVGGQKYAFLNHGGYWLCHPVEHAPGKGLKAEEMAKRTYKVFVGNSAGFLEAVQCSCPQHYELGRICKHMREVDKLLNEAAAPVAKAAPVAAPTAKTPVAKAPATKKAPVAKAPEPRAVPEAQDGLFGLFHPSMDAKMIYMVTEDKVQIWECCAGETKIWKMPRQEGKSHYLRHLNAGWLKEPPVKR